ncbi:MAG: hypothetical protein CMI29_06310 [Opitutae bacterium]|nr:hypothetical protein [Opitutae bacterium]|tara:strand:+ start:30513 stop:31169 length:657 start_codon:yes stop_codon:yes gene_type:complete
MKIACITYRTWAARIYQRLVKKYRQHTFLVWEKKESYEAAKLENFAPDLILWYGWSWMIEKRFTENFFSIMLHPSPLPKYRGGSPIQNQIINGDLDSAVTLFRITSEVDAGDILVQDAMRLQGSIDDIFEEITNVGFKATCRIVDGNYKSIPQNHEEATYYNRRQEGESEITLEEFKNKSGEYLYNKIRMLTGPYPRAFLRTKDGRKLFFENVSLSQK